MEKIQKQISQLKRMVEEAHEFLSIENVNQEIECLQSDLEILGSAPGNKKEIYYWLLIPYWLAAILIEEDETILQILSCNWWGISVLSGLPVKI